LVSVVAESSLALSEATLSKSLALKLNVMVVPTS